MRSLFSLDNPFNMFMTLVFDIILLNVLFVVCCVPLITIGASSTALYTVMLKRVKNDEGYIIKGFFGAFKNNFKQSIPLTLLFLGLVALLACDFLIVTRWQNSLGPVMQGLCYVLAIGVAAVFSYVWPLLAKFENTNRNILKNAALLSIAKLPWTVILTILKLLPIILFLFFLNAFSYVWWIWPLCGFSLTAYIASKILGPIFDSLTP